MSFHSAAYLFFLPCVFLLYWSMRSRYRWQNLLLVGASYVFYGWWDLRFLLLIALTTLCSYCCGAAMDCCAPDSPWRNRFNTVNIVFNLSILGLFKYYDFFAASVADGCRLLGFEAHPVLLHLLLPAGISFYTFQALSYTIDIGQNRLRAAKDPIGYAAFLCFFPQLVAGPIERATRLLPVFSAPRTFRYATAVEGLRRILWGLFKKMVIADNCAQVVDPLFAGWQQAGSGVLLLGGLLFTLQIYCDFSGYSDIAVGSAKLFGIELQENFRAPYFARSIADFWQRWHISLTSWLRDYVYIPLGGNRKGPRRTQGNIICVFLLSGLWHGAAWTFVCWGLFHALLFAPFDRLERYAVPLWMRRFLTLGCVVVGWILFRSANLSEAWGYLCRMVSFTQLNAVPPGLRATAIACAGACILAWAEYRTLPQGNATECFSRMPRLPRRIGYLLLAAAILTLGGENSAFIYFQF